MEKVVPIGCVVFVLEIQNPSECSPGQPGLADPTFRLLDQVISRGATQPQWFCGRVLSWFDTCVPDQFTCMLNLYKCQLTWLTLG